MSAVTDGACVVFDLDDTLYDELDFVASGFEAVAASMDGHDAERARDYLRARIRQRRWEGALNDLAQHLGRSTAVVADWLRVYRQHDPTIALRDGIASCLGILEALGVPLACVTDGRAAVQRRKATALGIIGRLSPFVVSEDVGCEKPCSSGFLRVAETIRAPRYCYVADNPRKDFIAPQRLGWHTIGLRNARSVHAQSHDPSLLMPASWCGDAQELTAALVQWVQDPASGSTRVGHTDLLAAAQRVES